MTKETRFSGNNGYAERKRESRKAAYLNYTAYALAVTLMILIGYVAISHANGNRSNKSISKGNNFQKPQPQAPKPTNSKPKASMKPKSSASKAQQPTNVPNSETVDSPKPLNESISNNPEPSSQLNNQSKPTTTTDATAPIDTTITQSTTVNQLDIFDLIDSANYQAIENITMQNLQVNVGLKNGMDPLNYACFKHELLIVKAFLSTNQFSVKSVVSRTKLTPLHFVCAGSERPENSVEIAKLLIDNGANIEALTKEKLTPLHFAIENSNVEMVQYLLSINARTDHLLSGAEDSFLHFAMQNCTARPIMKALIDRDPLLITKINRNNQYPIHTAAFYNCEAGLRELILTRKQDKNLRTPPMSECDHLEIFINEKGQTECPDYAYFKATPLHYAALGGSYEAAEFLVLIRAELSIMRPLDEEKSSPVDYAERLKDKEKRVKLYKFLQGSAAWNRKFNSKIVEDIEKQVGILDDDPNDPYSTSIYELFRRRYLYIYNPKPVFPKKSGRKETIDINDIPVENKLKHLLQSENILFE
jgi:ankyrin repeat protein